MGALSVAGCSQQSSGAADASCPLRAPALPGAGLGEAPPQAVAPIASGAVVAYGCSYGTDELRSQPRAMVLRGALLRRALAGLRAAPGIGDPRLRCGSIGSIARLRIVYGESRRRDVLLADARCARASRTIAVTATRITFPRGLAAELLDMPALYVAAGEGEAAAPDLIGTTLGEAVRRARDSGYRLAAVDQVADPATLPGHVADQRPPPGNVEDPRLAQRLPGAPPPELGVSLALADAPVCSPEQLAGRYRAGGVATGNNFGSIALRNAAGSCRLVGPIRLVGLDRRGAKVTLPVEIDVQQRAILVARTARTPRLDGVALGAFTAEITLSANARDDVDAPRALCDEHLVIPHRWQIAIGSEAAPALLVRNHDPRPRNGNAPGLLTCHGEIYDGGFSIRISGTS